MAGVAKTAHDANLANVPPKHCFSNTCLHQLLGPKEWLSCTEVRDT